MTIQSTGNANNQPKQGILQRIRSSLAKIVSAFSYLASTFRNEWSSLRDVYRKNLHSYGADQTGSDKPHSAPPRFHKRLLPLWKTFGYGLYRTMQGCGWVVTKMVALGLLLDFYLLYIVFDTWYGFTIYILSILLGFVGVGDKLTLFELACCLFSTYCLGTAFTVYLLLRNPKVEKWVFHHLGESRVRRLVYRSPGAGRFSLKAFTGFGGMVGIMVGANTVEHILHESSADERLHRCLERSHERYTADCLAADEARSKAYKELLPMHHKQVMDEFNKKLDTAKAVRVAEVNRAYDLRNAPYSTTGDKMLALVKSGQVWETISKGIDKIPTGR
jgi:hypothetical protein